MRPNLLALPLACLVLITACKKGDSPTPQAPSHLKYTTDTAITLKGISDTSVTPVIDWNGKTGTFSFAGAVRPGIGIDGTTGKITWAAGLPIGTYILPVVANSIGAGSDTTTYTLMVSGIITTIAGGAQGFSGDGGPALGAQLQRPFDVTTDAANNIYIADSYNHRIRKISPDGIINTYAGDGDATFFGDGGPALQASFSGPTGITLDAQHNMYVTDYGNSRIRKINAAGIVSTVAGKDYTTPGFLGDEGPATAAQLYLLAGKVALDAQGSLYIPDYGNQRIRKVTPDGIIHTIAGNGTMGAPIPDGTPGPNAPIGGPSGICYDPGRGSLFIVSNLASSIFRLTSGDLYTVAGYAAGLYRPSNIVKDADDNLYIADFGNNMIRRISPDGSITIIAGNGKAGYTGDGGPAAAASLNLPYGLAIDANGDLIIADSYNNRIRRVVLH